VIRPPAVGGWVVKVGGALAKAGALDGALAVIERLIGAGHKIVIVPGGGEYADFIRRHGAENKLPDETTHLQAILAVCQFGHEIAVKMKNARTVASATQARHALAAGKIPVYLPDGAITDSLAPKGWETTSDAIAGAICRRMGYRRLVLLKCVDGVMEGGRLLAIAPVALAVQQGIVDPVFPKALGKDWAVYIINGQHPERLAELIEKGRAEGTRVVKHGTIF